jgi:hypothetical protein
MARIPLKNESKQEGMTCKPIGFKGVVQPRRGFLCD